MSLRRVCLVIFIAVLVADQFSKMLVDHYLVLGESHALFPLFNFSLAYNQGAAFSMLSTAGGWQRWFLAALASIVSVFIAWWIIKLPERERLTGFALALVLGGAVGNLVDRIIYGYVIDFIDFYYPASGDCLPFFSKLTPISCHYATFNVADSAITVGAALLIITSLLSMRKDQTG
ncbi:MAG: lipoprotein signal peptidase [Gammaproteobacteria bacterium]|nr:lipoprotein signal peptidase [Gammaproteobacteria bacterium]